MGFVLYFDSTFLHPLTEKFLAEDSSSRTPVLGVGDTHVAFSLISLGATSTLESSECSFNVDSTSLLRTLSSTFLSANSQGSFTEDVLE